MLEIHSFMLDLARKRSLFHSEADFQHAFAWQLQLQYPTAKIRLEFPYEFEKWIYIDIWSDIDGKRYAIELKYKTAQLHISHLGEVFNLKNHGAQDLGRYDFLKDVLRLEFVTQNTPNTVGYAIMLTNDPSYWSPGQATTIDAAFRLHESRELSGLLKWGENASIGTTRGRTNPLLLRHKYLINWLPYSSLKSVRRGEFQYCVLEVTGD